jgi:hypothetical protein
MSSASAQSSKRSRAAKASAKDAAQSSSQEDLITITINLRLSPGAEYWRTVEFYARPATRKRLLDAMFQPSRSQIVSELGRLAYGVKVGSLRREADHTKRKSAAGS